MRYKSVFRQVLLVALLLLLTKAPMEGAFAGTDVWTPRPGGWHNQCPGHRSSHAIYLVRRHRRRSIQKHGQRRKLEHC